MWVPPLFELLQQQNLFTVNSIDEIRQSLANYLPNDKYFLAKNINTTNLYKLLVSYSYEFQHSEAAFKLLADNMNPWFTYEMLEDWERFLGIPDECFKITNETTIDMRHRYIIAKLSLMEVQTAEDWENLAKFFGYNIEIVYLPSLGEFPYTFPFFFYSDANAAAYTMYIKVLDPDTDVDTFPLPFPFTFGSREIGFLRCLFEQIKPAHIELLFLPESFFETGKLVLEDGTGFLLLEDGGFLLLES